MPVTLEVCAGSLASGLAAQAGGAQRVELCADLAAGGVTPSAGTIVQARTRLSIALHVLIRPRGGDFLYDDDEFASMRHDILFCRQAGVDGVVLGMLDADGAVDVARTRALVQLAGPLAVTFHRAFDLAQDPARALEAVIGCGCSRLLTSGQAASAADGADLIRRLALQAGDRLGVMPGGGIDAANIAALRDRTGCREFHASARAPVASAMRFRPQGVALGAAAGDPLARSETSAARVRALIAAVA